MAYQSSSNRRNPGYFQTMNWQEFKDSVKRGAYGNWDQVALRLAGDSLSNAVAKTGKHVSCPRHGGTDGFRLFNDFRLTGGAVCNTCGNFADGFALLQWLYGWNFAECVRAVGEVLGIAPEDGNRHRPVAGPVIPVAVPAAKSAEQVAREDEAKAMRMRQAWEGAFSIEDPRSGIGRDYLRNRGITSAVGPLEDIRFHPGLTYVENRVDLGKFPTLLCLLRQPNGNPTTLQRIYLTPEGAKAQVEHPKKMMPYRSTSQYAGSAVRLDHEVGAVLCAGEGVETCLAWRAMTGLPTWATCVAGLLEELVIPDSVRLVVVCGDWDLPAAGYQEGRGAIAAEKLVARVRESGRKAAAILPSPSMLPEYQEGADWLDVLGAYGLEQARQQEFSAGVREQVAIMLEGMGLEWADARAHY